MSRGQRAAPPIGEQERPPTDPDAPPQPIAESAVTEPETGVPEESTPPTGVIERPEPAAGRLTRLRARLARSQSSLGRGLLAVLSRDGLDDDAWEEIEDTLLGADPGLAATQELVERLRSRVRVEGVANEATARRLLREELVTTVGHDLERGLRSVGDDGQPGVVLVVGVNGTGKTTTVGRL